MALFGPKWVALYDRNSQSRLKDGIKKTTINLEIRGIKTAFNWAYKYDFIERNPFKGQDFMFDVESSKRAFTKEEIDKLLATTSGTHPGLIFRLTYLTGMRIGEVSKLTWNYVHLGNEPFIHIPTKISKTKKRDVPLVEKSLKVVHRLKDVLENKKQRLPEVYENRPPEETYLAQKQRGWGRYCERSIQDMFRKAMNEAGLPKELIM